jgi:hypothetical protein
MMSTRRWITGCTLSLLTLLAIPHPAAAGDVEVTAVKGADLAKFRTYRILPVRVLTKSGIVENDPDVSPLILSALRKELGKKGLVEVSDGEDLQVLTGALQVTFPTVEGYVHDVTDDFTLGTFNMATISRYNKEGTLFVNLVNPRDKKSVWYGFAKRALGKPSSMGRQVDKAAQSLFSKYPALPQKQGEVGIP